MVKRIVALFLLGVTSSFAADTSVVMTQEYQKLVLKLRADKDAVDTFVKKQAEACKPKLLSIDGDGFLACVAPPPPPPATPPAPAPVPAPTPEVKK